VHLSAKLLRLKISDSAGSGKSVRRYLTDRDVALSNILKSLDVCSGKSRVRTLAKKMNMWSENTAAIRWHLEAKKGSGFRPICNLPPVIKAKHRTISQIIVSQLELHPAIFGVASPEGKFELKRDRSKDAAALRVSALVRLGYMHMAEFDIKNCFQSFNPDGLTALTGLKIPEEVIRKNLDTRYLTFARKADMKVALPPSVITERSGPRGLLQGSPASSAILAWVLNGLIKNLPLRQDVELVVAFDNILVAAKSEAGLAETRRALGFALQDLPVGPLHLSEPNFLSREGINFLGYNIGPDRQISIAEGKLARLDQRLNDIEREFDGAGGLLGQYELLCDQTLAISDFSRGYPAAWMAHQQLLPYWEHIASQLPNIGVGRGLDVMHDPCFKNQFQNMILDAVRRRTAHRGDGGEGG
jgi:hypothetical protein